MFSKATVSSLASSYNWMKKQNPTDIPEQSHENRTRSNVHPLPFSKRTAFNRRLEKKVSAPPERLFVDLYSDSPSSKSQVVLKDPSSSSTSLTTSSNMYSKFYRKRPGGNHPPRRNKKKDNKKFVPIEIIDLTEPPSIETIRNNNDLYFTYDPRGVSLSNIPVGYCNYCRCPDPYCADKMFGRYCYEYMERLVGRMGFKYYKLETDIKWDFLTHYKNLLEMKLTFNNILVGDWKLDKDMEFPKCLRVGYYAKFLSDMKLWENREDEDAQPPIIMEFVDDDDIAMGLPPLLKRHDSESDDEVDGPSGMRRHASSSKTAVEQASDVGPMFKVMKQHLLNGQKKTSKMVNPYKKN